MPIPRPDVIRILLPILIRLCPELKEAQVTRGMIVPINRINPLNEAEEARNLSRKFTRERRGDRRADSSEVINLDTAIKIVEKTGGKGGLVAQVVRKSVVALLLGGTGQTNVTEDLLNPVIREMRENTLRQNTTRVYGSKVGHHRPAVGHGHGRPPPQQ